MSRNRLKSYQCVESIDCRGAIYLKKQIEEFNKFICWMSSYVDYPNTTAIGKYVKCLLKQHNMRIRFVIRNSASLEEFLSVCDSLLGSSIEKHIFFGLQEFTWNPVFSTHSTQALHKLDSITYSPQREGTFADVVDLSPLEGLRSVGRDAFSCSTGDVNLNGCEKLDDRVQCIFQREGCSRLKWLWSVNGDRFERVRERCICRAEWM